MKNITLTIPKLKLFLKKWFLLVIVIPIFSIPFVGLFIYDCTGVAFCELYTFGILELDKFFTLWISIFGAIGIVYTIIMTQQRIDLAQKSIDQQSTDQREAHFDKAI